MIFFLLVVILPFYFMLITSLKFEKNLFILPIQYIPNPITLQSYVEAWSDSAFFVAFVNSFVVSISVMVFVTVVSMFAGYALSRYTFRGKLVVTLLFLASQMVPQVLLIVPIFLIFKDLKLINTLFSLIITASTATLAYCLILMKGFFSGVSVQLEQAAQIDGCTKVQAVWFVILPLIIPGAVVTGSYAFVSSWNSYIMPLVLTNSPSKYTLPIALNLLIGRYTVSYTRLAAAGIICLLPAVLMFSYIQKYMVDGLATGSIKG
ncbi:MAG: carbohydrate ABC transporter permease [Treponemataceae bacterium]